MATTPRTTTTPTTMRGILEPPPSLDALDYAWDPDLDGDRPPVRKLRAMNLRNRSRRQRLGIDAGEQIRIEVHAHDRENLLERNRRQLVDEPAELLDVDIGQQVGPRGEELPELDVGGAELLERVAELACSLAGRRPVADDADLA